MTTIAYDGHDIAADSQYTSGTYKTTGVEKIIKLTDSEGKKCWVGLSGTTKLFKDTLTWVRRGKDEPKLNGEVEGLLIYEDGSVRLLVENDDGSLSWDEWNSPVAIGSGSTYAIGAMLAGKRARQAVNIAARVDTQTGGPVKVVNIIPRKGKTQESKDGLQQLHSEGSFKVPGSNNPTGRRRYR